MKEKQRKTIKTDKNERKRETILDGKRTKVKEETLWRKMKKKTKFLL